MGACELPMEAFSTRWEFTLATVNLPAFGWLGLNYLISTGHTAE